MIISAALDIKKLRRIVIAVIKRTNSNTIRINLKNHIYLFISNKFTITFGLRFRLIIATVLLPE